MSSLSWCTRSRPPDEVAGISPQVQALLAELVAHVPVKQAAALVSDVLGLPRKALYDDALRLRQSPGRQGLSAPADYPDQVI